MATAQTPNNESGQAAGSSPAANNAAPGLTLEIPVLSPEQVKASSPEAVTQLKQEGKAQADANLAALEAAFPDDPAFVLDCQKKGLNVDQAKAAKFDAVQQELTASKLKVKELEDKAAVQANQNEKPNVTFASSDKTDPPSGGGKDLKNEDQVQQEAGKVWQKNQHLAEEFDNIHDFYAYYKRNPNDDYSKRK